MRQGFRGQASMEYLMTYGWALLVLLAVLSILYSFGVFTPQQYMSEECLFQPSLQCRSMELTKDGTFNLRLNNGLGYEIKNVKFELIMLSTGEQLSDEEVSGQTSVKPNTDITIKDAGFLNTGKFRAGSLEKIKISINYEADGQGYKTSGVVAVRVSPS